MADTYYLGADAVIYYLPPSDETADDAAARVIEILAGEIMANVGNVNVTLDKEEQDVTTHGGGGYKGTWGAIKKCSVEFTLICTDPPSADDAYIALRDAFFNTGVLGYQNGFISMAVLSGPTADPLSRGPVGDFYISGLSRPEPSEGVIEIGVTAKLNKFYGYEPSA